jgi:hypothetical protein
MPESSKHWMSKDIFTEDYQKKIANKPIKDYQRKPVRTEEQVKEFQSILDEYMKDVPDEIITPLDMAMASEAQMLFYADPRIIKLSELER